MTVRPSYTSLLAEDLEQEEKSGVHRKISLRVLPETKLGCPDVGPCGYVSCKWNTAIDVTRCGTIKFPHGEDPYGWPQNNCALDNADQGGMTLDEVAAALGVVKERARQIEEGALRKLSTNARVRRMLRG